MGEKREAPPSVVKILIASHHFAPSIGGTEAVASALGRGLQARGHQVRVVTRTLGCSSFSPPLEVARHPVPQELIRLTRWADVVLMNQLTLGLGWPALIGFAPWVVGIHNWLEHMRHEWHPLVLFKKLLLRRARAVVYASEALARGRWMPQGSVIHNPVDLMAFTHARSADRRGVICVGRLVSDKGFDTVVRAMALLEDSGVRAPLTFVGEGPEEAGLRTLAARLGIGSQTRFLGALDAEGVAQEMGRSSICAVPSKWEEPFGIVAIEALAAGCRVIVSDVGGLPEAVGQHGIVVPANDVEAWAEALARELSRLDPFDLSISRQQHLDQFHPELVIGQWEALLQEAVG